MTNTPADAIAAALARAAELGLETTNDRPGPTIQAGHLSLGFLTVGDDTDITVLNRLTGARSVRHCHDAASVADAAAMFIFGATL